MLNSSIYLIRLTLNFGLYPPWPNLHSSFSSSRYRIFQGHVFFHRALVKYWWHAYITFLETGFSARGTGGSSLWHLCARQKIMLCSGIDSLDLWFAMKFEAIWFGASSHNFLKSVIFTCCVLFFLCSHSLPRKPDHFSTASDWEWTEPLGLGMGSSPMRAGIGIN